MASDSYHAFFSYNSDDRPFVSRVAAALERLQLRPWLDAWHLVPGEAWQPAIVDALQKSGCCVVFVGPSGIGAWQLEEMQAAIVRRVKAARSDRPFRVIPVLLPGAKRGDDLSLPVFLKATTWVEFRSDDDADAIRTLERAIRGLSPREEPTPSDSPVRLIRVFVSSPGDVQAEREILDRVARSISNTDGKNRGFWLETQRWEKHFVPRIGPRPQTVVDAQTLPYDIYVGIMSVRFGTPTDTAESGTEDEFNAALAQWQKAGKPWILFYFNDDPGSKAIREQLDQFVKVDAFRKKLDKLGLVAGYHGLEGGDDAFRNKVDEHLRNVVYTILPATTSSPNSSPSASPLSSNKAPASVRYYLKQLVEQTKNLEMLGMGRGFQVELPIADAYVPLRTIRPSRWERVDLDRAGLEPAETDAEVDLKDVFRECQKLDYRGVILLGEPGSGKTTGARQLAWRLASGDSRSEDLGLPAGMRPVLLRFRNLNPELVAAQPKGVAGLRAFLEQETHCPGAPDDAQQAGRDLWNDTGHGLLWILDGLDEVVDAELRAVVAGWIRSALPLRPDDWFLVTSRFQGYLGSGVMLGAKFVEFHVKGLSQQQIDEFVPKWFGVAHRKMQGPGEGAERRARTDSEELLGVLARPAYQTSSMREMVTNPLLLTILCIVYHEEHNLPTGRAELYQHCVRVLLALWRRELYDKAVNQGGPKPYDAEAAQAVLARLAWWLHQQEQRTAAPLDELSAEATKALRQVSSKSELGLDGDKFIDRMRTESGILAMGGDGQGKCGFLHLSFQEFLAADYAAREGLARNLAPRIAESWWREVALLSLRRSKSFCEEFFAALLAAGIAESNPDLADRCLEESLYFTPAPFVSVLEQADSPPSRVAAVLRLLRNRSEQVPELANLCVELARSTDVETRGFAREILVHLGVSVPAPAGPRPLDVIVDERTGVTLVALPPGKFLMGSEKGHSNEQPVHRVRLTQGFLLGKYPVTNAQYGRYLDAVGGKARKPAYWEDRRSNQPEQPVVGVSWDEAVAYCEWAGGRLPTEAEWEYACRAGTTTEYCFGDDAKDLGEYAWYDANSDGQPQPAGAKKPNAWGLHDMYGNVWEWCGDWYGAYGASEVIDPTGPPRGSYRVYRGGSWFDSAGCCRSAYRDGGTPDYRIQDLGFRLALVPVAGAEL